MEKEKKQINSRILFGLGVLVGGLLVGGGWYVHETYVSRPFMPVIEGIKREKPLDKYAITSLQNRTPVMSQVKIGTLLKTGEGYKSYRYFFTTEGDKRVSGMMNIPSKPGEYPAVIMFRGYVDRESYTVGEGTKHAGEVLARNGYITFAPDFLGYGESDLPANDSIEARFQTYTTGLDMLNAIKQINKALVTETMADWSVDENRVAIWGHSNGGHIAIAMLEITGKEYPTTLWAPVTKPFPYSILYYTDEFSDRGKALRFAVSRFEWDYDADKYSIAGYLNEINAPIILHQGTRDNAVPTEWSDEFNKTMHKLDKQITYYKYPGDNHNFSGGSWNQVVERDLAFFEEKM